METHRLSAMMIPSSMHETLVFLAPMSMTQAFEIPAPKLAQIPSYKVNQYGGPLGTIRDEPAGYTAA
jgi:hypothetical protein